MSELLSQPKTRSGAESVAEASAPGGWGLGEQESVPGGMAKRSKVQLHSSYLDLDLH